MIKLFKPEDFNVWVNDHPYYKSGDPLLLDVLDERIAKAANHILQREVEKWPDELAFNFDGRLVLLDKEDWLDVISKEIKFVNERPCFNQDGKTIYLYRHILKADEGIVVDHINGNPLDNRKSNLRLCSQAENCYNSAKRSGAKSKYKGVSIRDEAKPFRARLHKDGKEYHLGSFETEIEAAIAYDVKAKEMFGEFARLNFGLAFIEEIKKECTKHEPKAICGVKDNKWFTAGHRCIHCDKDIVAEWKAL